MKDFYYVSHKPKLGNVYVLHIRDCWVLPTDRKYIGRYLTHHEALEGAEEQYKNVAICEYCINNPDPG